jgi:hypothetical protein
MARTPDRFSGRREEDSILLTGSTSLPNTSGEFTYATSSVSGSGFLFNDNGTIKSLGIQLPINPTTGSLLYFDGNTWTYLSGGPEGYSLISNGPNALPSWEFLSSSSISYNFITNSYGSENISLTGSNTFGSLSSDLQQFTGSVSFNNGLTGSLFGTASYALNSDLLDGIDSTQFARLDIGNTFNGDQIVSGNVTITGTASINVLVAAYEVPIMNYISGSSKFGSSAEHTHEFTGSVRVSGSITGSLYGTSSYSSNSDKLDGLDSIVFARLDIDNQFVGNQIITGSVQVLNGITGSLFGTSSYSTNALNASYSSNSDLLDGLDSTAFVKNNTVSLTLDGVVLGNTTTLIGSFYIPTASVYSTSSFVYFGGSQGTEEASFEIRGYSSPSTLLKLTKTTTLSIMYLTSSLSLNSGLYNIYLYSSGAGTAIAKSIYLTL